jgi:ketopantoate reductase
MTCTVVGPGLVGCFLGAAAGSQQVITSARGQIRAQRVRLANGVREWEPQRVTTAQPDIPLLITCRVHQANWAHYPTDCLVAQNGIGQPRPVAVCFFALDVDQGVLHSTGPQPRLALQNPGKKWHSVMNAWENAGIIIEIISDIRVAQWEKVILNATVGPLCLSTGLSMAGVWQNAELQQLALEATIEGVRIAHAEGIACDQQLPARAQAFFSQVGDHRPSVVADAGELPWVLPPLLDAAHRHRINAPALERIASLVAAAKR